MNNLLLLSPAHGDLGIVYVCDQDFFFIHEHDKEFDTFVDLLQYLQDYDPTNRSSGKV